MGQSKRRQGLRSELLFPDNQHLQRGGQATLHHSKKESKEMLKGLMIRQATKAGVIFWKRGGLADLSFPTSTTRRGRVQGDGDLSPTILAGANEICLLEVDKMNEDKEAVRRITPREAWRLMDFSDEDYKKAEAVNSQTALYAQAGNAIVRQVLIDIFAEMIPQERRKTQC